MKLPLDYKMPSLNDLQRVVALLGRTSAQGVAWNEKLEMTEDQYLRYKVLLWKSDPIRFFRGMEIEVEKESGPKAAATE